MSRLSSMAPQAPPAAAAIPFSRHVYRHAELKRLFEPGSVAIVGASPNPGSVAYLAMLNMQSFGGEVYPVNAKYERIGDKRCYPSLAALPRVPDCVVVAVGREGVEGIVEECAALGVGGVVVFAAGYSETGKADRVAQQARITAIARRSGMRLLGPNSVGLLNHAHGLAMSFTPSLALAPASPSAIGLVSQSGGLGNGLTQALHRSIAFSHTLSTGNSCDVDCADCIAYLAESPQCKAIALIFEGVESTARLLEAGALAWANNKPLVVFKLGRGAQGAEAALSHSGFVAGSSTAYRAALERMGAIFVDRFEALIETAAFFAKAPPAQAQAQGVAVISASGGTVVHAADEAELHGVALPPMGALARETIAKLVPEFAIVKNPFDLTSSPHGPQRLLDCTEALLDDPVYAAVVAPHVYSFAAESTKFKKLGDMALRHGKPIVVNWISEWTEGPGSREGHTNPHVAVFRSTSDAFAALAAWLQRSRRRAAPAAPYVRTAAPEAAAQAAALIAGATGKTLTEREAKRVLKLYGVPVVEEQLARNADEAVAAAQAFGVAVALKVESPDIPHKTEAKAIRLGCKTDAEVRAAFAEVIANAQLAVPDARINGVLVQPMMPAGAEIMVGGRIDAQFGPLVVVGLGGVLVELLNDAVVALAPVGVPQALELLGRIRGQAALSGFRGAQPIDLNILASIVCRVSELVADQRDSIAEIDVNPLICAGASVFAVDALIAKPQ